MTTDRIVAEEPWHFVIFERAGSYFATYLTGGPVETDNTVRLAESEVAALKDPGFPKTLIERFRANTDALSPRLVSPPIWPHR